MQAVFFYVLYEAERQYLPRNFHTFLMIISEAKVMEEEGAKSPLDYRFQALDDNHIAKRTYRKFMSGARRYPAKCHHIRTFQIVSI